MQFNHTIYENADKANEKIIIDNYYPPLIQDDSCPFLAKECAQELVNRLED